MLSVAFNHRMSQIYSLRIKSAFKSSRMTYPQCLWPSAKDQSSTKANHQEKKKQHSLLSFSLSYLPTLPCFHSSGGFSLTASYLGQKPY